MRAEKVRVIALREYLARVRSLGFWLATLGLPVLMAAALLVPMLLLTQTRTSHKLIVVDVTGELGEAVVQELSRATILHEEIDLEQVDEFGGFEAELEEPAADLEGQRAELDRRIRAGEVDAWVWIDRPGLDANRIEYHAQNVSNVLTQARLTRALSGVVRTFRLESAGLDPEEIARLGRSVHLTTVRVTEEGSREEGAATGIALAYVLFFLLYIALLVYGQQVLVGVIEEKSSRVVEVIVATTRPTELMFGKFLGICCVAMTQLGIWIGAVAIFTLPSVVGRIGWISDAMELPRLDPMLALHFFLFFVIGFFLYSTFYGSVGAAANNVQEAQQFASVGAIFVIAPMLLSWIVLNDPDSTLSVVTSLIPVFTPLLMMLRLAVKAPPTWQVALGYALTLALTWVMIWVCARIYRVGILMYGKKPSLPEIWRWIRY